MRARLCLRVSFIADQCVYVCSSVRGKSSPVCRKLGTFFSYFSVIVEESWDQISEGEAAAPEAPPEPPMDIS